MSDPTIAVLTGLSALAIVAVGGFMLLKTSAPSKPKEVLLILDESGELIPTSNGPNQQALADFSAYDERVKNPLTIVVPSGKESGFGYYPLERKRKRKARKTRKNVA